MTEIPTADAIRDVLADVPDPETGRGLVRMEQVQEVAASGDVISVTIALTTHSRLLWKDTLDTVEQKLRAAFPGMANVNVSAVEHQRAPQPLGEIGLTAKSVIAVGSGKGGVGKSTIAVAMAESLRRAGCVVGLMDADVYGPSVPHLLGMKGQPAIEDKKIQPIEKNGLKAISMGFLVKPGEAMVWRGPMLHGAIMQFLRDTAWGNLDYLIIDMPPGTGDVALTLSQLLPLTGAVVVCTPQEVALLDAVKSISMFQKVNIPILGMVENMSGFVCPGCNKRYDIFGSGGARRCAEELAIPFLGEVPINVSMRERGDAGEMSLLFDDPISADVLDGLTYRLVKNLATTHAEEPPLPPLSVL